MEKFYSKFFDIVKTSSDNELIGFRKLVTSEIQREFTLRKGFKQKKAGAIVSQKPIRKGIAPIPPTKKDYVKRIKYLEFILSQKWEYLFDDHKLSEERKYYVYAHCDPTIIGFDISGLTNIKGIPFYIGKGTGDRHLDLDRNQGHDVKMRNILKKGCSKENIIRIVRENLTEKEALALESKLIYLFQTVYENQLCGVLYNLDIGRRPDFDNNNEYSYSHDIIIRNKETGVNRG